MVFEGLDVDKPPKKFCKYCGTALSLCSRLLGYDEYTGDPIHTPEASVCPYYGCMGKSTQPATNRRGF